MEAPFALGVGHVPDPVADARLVPDTAFPGARFVMGFNHLGAAKLAADPDVTGGRQVIFFASDDAAALAPAAALAEQLVYAPVSLGTLAEGGMLAPSVFTAAGTSPAFGRGANEVLVHHQGHPSTSADL